MISYPTLAKRSSLVLLATTGFFSVGVFLGLSGSADFGAIEFNPEKSVVEISRVLHLIILLAMSLLVPLLWKLYLLEYGQARPVRFALLGWTLSAIYHLGLVVLLIGWLPTRLRLYDFKMSGAVQFDNKGLILPLTPIPAACALLSLWIAVACWRHSRAQAQTVV